MKYLCRFASFLAILSLSFTTRANEPTVDELNAAMKVVTTLQSSIQRGYLVLSETGNLQAAEKEALEVIRNYHTYTEEERKLMGEKIGKAGVWITSGSVFALLSSKFYKISADQIARNVLRQTVQETVDPKKIAGMILRKGSIFRFFQDILDPRVNRTQLIPILNALETVPGMGEQVVQFEAQYVNPIQAGGYGRSAAENIKKSSYYRLGSAARKLDQMLRDPANYPKVRNALVANFGSDVVNIAESVESIPSKLYQTRSNVGKIFNRTAHITAYGGLAAVVVGVVYQMYLNQSDIRPLTEDSLLMMDLVQLRDYLYIHGEQAKELAKNAPQILAIANSRS